MKIITKDIQVLDEINKSKFITYLKYVENTDDAKEFIKEIKNKYVDATHVVSTYIIGTTGEQGHASDDGEPSGTAAMPMMDVFKKNNCTNFVCCCIRYFGGIKLGAGGLVRAYSTSASHALKEAGIKDLVKYSILSFNVKYEYSKIIDNLLKDYDILNKTFNEKVSYSIKIEETKLNDLKIFLINTTNNNVNIDI